MLSLLLAGVGAVQLGLPFTADLPESTALMPRRVRLAVPPLPADYPEILRRPIFAVDRHPMTDAMEGFVLLGTGAVGNAYTALLQAGGRVFRAHAGDTVMGWHIASLASDRVLFERGVEKRVLLFDLKSRRAAIAPPPVARSQ
jgi:hypothetical protein